MTGNWSPKITLTTPDRKPVIVDLYGTIASVSGTMKSGFPAHAHASAVAAVGMEARSWRPRWSAAGRGGDSVEFTAQIVLYQTSISTVPIKADHSTNRV